MYTIFVVSSKKSEISIVHSVFLILNSTFFKFLPKNILLLFITCIFSIILTFNFVNLSFIFFKNKDFSDSVPLIDKMFNLNNDFFISEIYTFDFKILFILLFILTFYFANTYSLVKKIYEKQ